MLLTDVNNGIFNTTNQTHVFIREFEAIKTLKKQLKTKNEKNQ